MSVTSVAVRLPRTYLFVPGNRPERFDKAAAAGADAVIIDLEDAVPPACKADARGHVAAWLAAGHQACLRINGADTAWFLDDVAALAACPGVMGIVLPKTESAAQVADVLANAHAGLMVLPIIETARGFARLDEISAASGVQRLLFGSLDFQVDLGIEDDDAALLPFRMQLVMASRVAGIGAPVDGVTTALDDPDVLRAESERARRLGFRGKLCIHPKQIAPVHRAFAPTDAQLAWARRVLAAVEASAGAAVAVDGKMVDMPVILQAREIVSRAP